MRYRPFEWWLYLLSLWRAQLGPRPSARRRDRHIHNTSTRDEHPCPQRDANPRSEQYSGHRRTP